MSQRTNAVCSGWCGQVIRKPDAGEGALLQHRPLVSWFIDLKTCHASAGTTYAKLLRALHAQAEPEFSWHLRSEADSGHSTQSGPPLCHASTISCTRAACASVSCS